MPLFCCRSLPSAVTINDCFNLEGISHFPAASLPPNNCGQCSALSYREGQAGKEMALGELPVEKKLRLWRLTVYEGQEMIHLKRGISLFCCPKLSTVTVACSAQKQGHNMAI